MSVPGKSKGMITSDVIIPLLFPVTDIQRKIFFIAGTVSDIDKGQQTRKSFFLMSSLILGEVMTQTLEFSQRHIAEFMLLCAI